MPGTYSFRVWGYGTTDPLEDVLGQDYFRSAGGLMHAGDLIDVAVRPPCASVSPRAQRQWAESAELGQMRMALVMVRAGENGAPSVRLVQDFGCPDDPPGGPAVAPSGPDASPSITPAAPVMIPGSVAGTSPTSPKEITVTRRIRIGNATRGTT